MVPPGESRTRIGSAFSTDLYALDPNEVSGVDEVLRERAARPPALQPIAREDLPREVKLRVSEMVAKGSFEPPRLPEIAFDVLRMAENDRASAEHLAALIHRDAFLAGRLLRTVNSAMYRPRDRAITRLPEAVTRLGLMQVRSLVLAAAMEQSVYHGPRRLILAELWQASLGAAAGARLTAHLLGRDTDNGFLLGLVHDVGKPVLVWCLDRVLRDRAVADVAFDDVAPEVFHLLHARLSAMIVRHWQLPEGMAQVVAHHHDPRPPDGVASWTRVLRVAELLYQTWRDDPQDLDPGGALHAHPLLRRTFPDPRAVERLLCQFPASLEALLAG